jgi:uncharacterized protein (TIGR03435 family)
MAWTKAKTTIVAGAGVLLVAIATRAIYQHYRYYSWQVQNPYSINLDQVPPQVKIVPARYSSGGGICWNNGKVLGIGQSIDTLLQLAYNTSKDRMVFSSEMPRDLFDFIANLPEDNVQALQREFEKTSNLSVRKEKRQTDVLLLTLKRRNAGGLRRSAAARSQSSSRWMGDKYEGINVPLSTLVLFLQQRFNIPVVDQTGLAGQFDIDISWRHSYPDTLKQAVVNDLGLELVPGRIPIEMLMVEAANQGGKTQ